MSWKLVPIVLGLVGCAGQQAAYMQRQANDLTTRAAFDFDCPQVEIKTQKLNDSGTLMGATGCGQRATYMTDGYKWIMNTVSGEPTREAHTTTQGANQ